MSHPYLQHLEDTMEEPAGWHEMSSKEQEGHTYFKYLKALESAYLREKATQAVQANLNPPGTLRLIDEAEVLSRPAPVWIVPGLIQESGITELAGPPGIGKTFLCIALARAVATGRHFFGRPTQYRKVLYVAGEGTAAFGQRITAWNHANHTTVQPGQMTYVEEGVNLADDESVNTLCEWIAVKGFGLIVLDTFSQLSGIQDENAAGPTAAVFRNIKRLRDASPGSAVLVVHHMNAGGTKARGSTVHLANSDLMAVVRGRSDAFSVSTLAEHGAKIKDGKAEEWHGFSLAPVSDSCVVVNNGGKRAPGKYEGAVLQLLADGTVKTSKEIREACGIETSTGADYKEWQREVAYLAREERIVNVGNKTHPKYQMTETWTALQKLQEAARD